MGESEKGAEDPLGLKYFFGTTPAGRLSETETTSTVDQKRVSIRVQTPVRNCAEDFQRNPDWGNVEIQSAGLLS
jgi:hypothetical protein